jgi:beta-N-acetylhexosaminidase
MQMKAIVDHYGLIEATRLAINAGANILIFGNQLAPIPQTPLQMINIINKEITAHHISQVRIEESYQRVMQLKAGIP